MEQQRILIVEDQREFSRMLRSALETVGIPLNIVDVPSGEEAMLEVRRRPFDLIITDIMLPGMDGIELIERVRKVRPTTLIVVITGSPTHKLEKFLAETPQFAFFTKPLDLPEVLNKVREALGVPIPESDDYSEELGHTRTSASGLPSDSVGGDRSLGVRLSGLRSDLGAQAVFLVDENGDIVVRAGDVTALEMDPVLNHLEVAFNAGLRVSAALGKGASLNLQYFDGVDHDMYVANVGQFYMLVMLFSGEQGANQMGPVMRYGRRAADDVLNMLAAIGLDEPTDSVEPDTTDRQYTTRVTGATAEVEAEIMAILEAAGKKREAAAEAKAQAAAIEATQEEVLPEAGEAEAAAEEPLAEDEEQPIELNLDLLDEAMGELESSALDADSFWDTGDTPEGDRAEGSNLSFEQALKLGLFEDEE